MKSKKKKNLPVLLMGLLTLFVLIGVLLVVGVLFMKLGQSVVAKAQPLGTELPLPDAAASPTPEWTHTPVPSLTPVPATATFTPTQPPDPSPSPLPPTATATVSKHKTAGPTPKATRRSSTARSSAACSAPDGWIVYRVRSGDTLYALSRATGASVSQIQAANCLGSSTLIYAGANLLLPPAYR